MNRLVKKRRAVRWRLLALLLIWTACCGCRTLSYYGQAIHGQYQILSQRQSIPTLIADPRTPADLKRQLELVQQLRAFAGTELKLPVDGHYQKYTDVHRPYVVWNVQAASEFSLQPKTWWYPIVGSLEYRGYFSETNALDCSRELWVKGCDVYVDGVEAYSTLGWFADPVLSTFVRHDESQLAETLFHELAHQKVFARGDTDFNEAYATTVGQEGARRWLLARGNTNALARYLVARQRNDQFVHLILNTRTNLQMLYGDTRDEDGRIQAAKNPPASPERLRREKQRVFGELRRDYAQLKVQWNGFAGYDGWFASELNNAQLNTVANYYDLVPAFERLLRANGGDLEQFYQAVKRLAGMSKEERRRRLNESANVSPVVTTPAHG